MSSETYQPSDHADAIANEVQRRFREKTPLDFAQCVDALNGFMEFVDAEFAEASALLRARIAELEAENAAQRGEVERLKEENADLRQHFRDGERAFEQFLEAQTAIAALTARLDAAETEKDAEIERLQERSKRPNCPHCMYGKLSLHGDEEACDRCNAASTPEIHDTTVEELQKQISAKDAMLAAAREFKFGSVYFQDWGPDGSPAWSVERDDEFLKVGGSDDPDAPNVEAKTFDEAYQAALAAGWLSQEAQH